MAMAMNPNRVYEDYDPPSDLVLEQGSDTILVYLPGFKKEQLRVQLTTSRILKVSGERPVGENKWRRFHKEFRVPVNCDTKGITAKFEGGILSIRQPKVVKPPTPPPAEKPQDNKLAPGKPAPEETQKPQPQPQAQPQPQPQPQAQAQAQAPPPEPPKGSQKEEEKAQPSKLDEEMKHKREPSTAGQMMTQVAAGNRLLRELRKPENLKRLAVSVLVVLTVAFSVSYLVKSFTTRNDQQNVLEFNQEL